MSKFLMREKSGMLTVTLTGLSKDFGAAGEMGKEMGDFLILVFLMFVSLYVCSEKLVHLSELMAKCAGCLLTTLH